MPLREDPLAGLRPKAGSPVAEGHAPLFARFALWSAEVDSFGRQIDDFSARIDAAIKRSTPLDGDKM
jgi:hypothetical protein